MEISACSKWASKALLIFIFLASNAVFAYGTDNDDDKGYGYQPPRKKYTFSDFVNYFSSFSKVPSTFTWDNVPQNQGSPGRVVIPDSVPTPVPVIGTPAAAPPTCLATSPWGDIYAGACVSTSPTIPYVEDANIGYDGTYCYGKLGAFRVTYSKDALGTLETRDVIANPPLRNQYQINKTTGQIAVACSDLATPGGAALSIPGKPLSGEVIFRCQAGVWRLISVSCSDYEVKCSSGIKTVTFGASDGTSYPVSMNLPVANINTVGPSVACTSLGSPGDDYNWAGGSVYAVCDGAGQWSPSGTCVKNVKPVTNTVYPNCAGAVLNEIKVGIKSCQTADATRYYWVLIEGSPVVQCADPNGCLN